jgi:hypothetical protein
MAGDHEGRAGRGGNGGVKKYAGAAYLFGFLYYLRLFQNFSFWNSFLRFNRKTGLLTGFSKSLFQN